MKKLFQKYLVTKWPPILWSVIIFILLAMPAISIAKENQLAFPMLDKIIHAFLFGFLVLLWGFYLQPKYCSASKFLFALTGIVFLSTFYGICMEYVQLWVGRDFDVWDMLADGMGAAAAWLFFAVKNRPR